LTRGFGAGLVLDDCEIVSRGIPLAQFPKKRVLVVEECGSGREAVGRILAQMGYDVIAIGTLAEGLAALDPPPHGILLDLVLPDGPGELLLETVSAAGFARRVIVCTAVSDPSRLDAIRRLEPAAVLSKPVPLAKLVAVCRALPSGEERKHISAQLGPSGLPIATLCLKGA
jgi:DNA-binding response OmpR family regulator